MHPIEAHSQKHRVGQVGREHRGSAGSASLLRQGSLGTLHSTAPDGPARAPGRERPQLLSPQSDFGTSL